MITIELEGFEKAVKSFDPQIVKQAAMMAINEASSSARTEASRAIRARFNLPASRVDREVNRVYLASRSDLTAIVRAQGRPIGLPNFGAKWVRNVKGTARTTTGKSSKVGKREASLTGVFAQIVKGKTTHLPHAFMARGRRGNVDGAGAMQVFQRRDAKNRNSPLINRATITIATMMNQERVMDLVIKKAGDTMEKRFLHHLDRLLR